MKTSVSRNKGHVYSVGNYLMNGKVLGKGHFARVEEATHRIIGKKVAIKIIDLTCIKEEYARRNLHREPKVMARLRHPCIAALYETMMHGPRLYVVMEAAGGGDLCAHVLTARAGAGVGIAGGAAGGRGLPESRARALSAQLVSAVKHMHARGVVHRDLKMENIMLDSTKQFIKIVDFGLSNVWNSNGGLRTPCGSLEYAAPELFLDGRRYGPEVDLWSVGVIVYGMVTGALPFGGAAGCAGGEGAGGAGAGRSRPQLRAAIARGFSRKHRAALSAFSPECKVFVQQLLEPNVETRMKVEEAARHRWLRRPGMRLQAHPLPALELKNSRAIAKQISELSGQSLTDIVAEIKADPYGSVGGMYNIKTHTTQLQHAGSDMLWTSAPDTQPRPVSPPIYHPHSTSLFKHSSSIQSTNSTAAYRQGSPSHTNSPVYKQHSTYASSSAYRQNSPPSHTTNSTTIYKLNSPSTQLNSPANYKQPSTQPTHSPAIYKQNPSTQSTNSPAIYKQNPTQSTNSPAIYKQNPAQSTNSPAIYKQNPAQSTNSPAIYNQNSISTNTPIIYKQNPAPQSTNSPAIYKHPSTPTNSYKNLPPSPANNPPPSSYRTVITKLRSPALAIRKPMYKVHDNGDGAEPRLQSIDEHSKLDVHDKYPRVRGRAEGEKLRLHSCPERTERRADFYRRAGDGLPSWRATGVTNTASARILLQSNATTIKRASLGNIVSPHSSSNSHCKSERAVPVGWFSSRNSTKDTTSPLQRLRRTAPIK